MPNGHGYTYSVYSATSKTEFASGYNSGYVTYVHKLSTPQVTAATNYAKGASTVKWAKVPNAKSYQVYRSDKLNGNYAKVGSASKDVLQYTDKSVKKGKTYYYKVVAYAVNDCGQIVKSATSKAKSVKINK